MRTGVVVVCAAGLASAGAAHGEIKFGFDVSGIITPDNPSVTVEVWAYFDPAQYAFAGALFDVVGGSDAGGFSDPHAVLDDTGTDDGLVSGDGDRVMHVIAGQIHFPPADELADTSNPILIWEATWSTDDFSTRQVSLATETSKYHLYIDDLGHSKEFVDELAEAVGQISVVPAPGAAMALGVMMVASRRRR
jgi:hypothetical protein